MLDLSGVMEQKTAIVFGASGLIGSQVVSRLLKDNAFGMVKEVVRRAERPPHPKLKTIIADYDTLPDHQAQLSADIVFCCLGSTMKKTPDMKAYYQIDHDYPLRAAFLLKDLSASQFHLVSSIGANPDSRNFYLRMKGETERDIEAVGFNCLYIYRPSLLTGQRREGRGREHFFASVMKIIDPLFIGSLKNYRSISGETVARSMIKTALVASSGIHYIQSKEIKEIL